jgi:hypothetical protein
MNVAPDDIQRIVQAVLNDSATNLIVLDQEPGEEVKKYLRDGRRAAVAVRDFLRDYADCVYETEPDPGGRYVVDVLYVMLPEVRERGRLKRMYAKFVLLVDHEDEAYSQLTVVRFHKDLDMDPITSFPPPKR